MKQLRFRADESGSALVLALVFLSLFGVFIAVLLGFTDTSIRSTLAVRSQGATAYAADGAVDAAINTVRGNLEAGRAPGLGVACDQVVPDLNGVAVTVTCQGQTGSGNVTIGAANPNNHPARAILTVSSSEGGIDQGSNSDLKIHGSVFSNSTITNTGANASLTSDGDVAAVGNCSGTINTPFPLKCANQPAGAANPANGTDPNYAAAITTIPSLVTAPSCPGSGWLVDLQPGYYNDATALSALADSGCPGKVLWFHPGVYYFDFQNPSGGHEWTVDNAGTNIVGGTPKGWSTGAATRPLVPIPGGCKTDQDAAPNDGVQFIFGGDSRINVPNGKVELCAQPSTSQQQIAIYGLKTGTAASVGPNSLRPTGSTNVAGTSFANAPGAFTPNDGQLATVAAIPKKQTAAIMLTGFDQTSIPTGATINSAVLHVRHSEDAASLRVTVTPATGSAITVSDSGSCAAGNLCIQSTLAENTINLPGLTASSQFPIQSVKYEVNAKSGSSGSASLDAVWIDVTYTPAGLRAQSGCITVTPYPGPSACALVKTSGAQSTFILQGTIYAPKSAVDVQVTNVSTQVFGRGIVARTLEASITPSAAYTGPTIAVPDDSPANSRTDRVVTLTAYVNGGARLRAVVTFKDNNGANPGQFVDVNSWSVLR